MVNFKRPPYYRPPRQRPVTFVDPQNENSSLQTVIKALNNQSTDFNMTQVSLKNKPKWCYADILRDPPDHNRAPRPFIRPYQADYQQASNSSLELTNQYQKLQSRPQAQSFNLGPRIVVDQYRDGSEPRVGSYPTSTVHKSMLTSGRSIREIENESQFVGSPSNRYVQNASVESRRNGTVDANISQANLCQSCRNQKVHRFSHACECLKDDNLIESQQPQARAHLQWFDGASQANWSRNEPSASIPKASLGSDQTHRPEIARQFDYRPHSFKEHFSGSSTLRPETKEAEFMRMKQLEQATIAHQTYRTLPIVQPKPKARHDISLGTTYMHLNQDPTYDLAIESSKQSKLALSRSIGRKIEAAMNVSR